MANPFPILTSKPSKSDKYIYHTIMHLEAVNLDVFLVSLLTLLAMSFAIVLAGLVQDSIISIIYLLDIMELNILISVSMLKTLLRLLSNMAYLLD